MKKFGYLLRISMKLSSNIWKQIDGNNQPVIKIWSVDRHDNRVTNFANCEYLNERKKSPGPIYYCYFLKSVDIWTGGPSRILEYDNKTRLGQATVLQVLESQKQLTKRVSTIYFALES
ncbi:hypothetical protein WA026_005863 [Henosepilachna vigintioctopunctata]|uniref:Uncharacterized protein n=1 Tax=Henosepilachna vigintioctopunctata TaxID=420089 RepID=A0AAW1TXR4_9CUCU